MSSARRKSSAASDGIEDVWARITREVFSTPSEKNGNEAKENPESEENGGETPQNIAVAPPSANESFALCVGMPSAGKSSLLNAYLSPNKDENPKPTAALEYMFARRATTANTPKDMAHIWELGGGQHVSDLVAVPITVANFQSALYMVVLDLSRPSDIIEQLTHWTDQIKACVKACVRETSKKDPSFAEGLKRSTYSKFGKDHPDLRLVKPCPVPLLIVANKYDKFKDEDGVKRKVVGQALRFVAHMNGASLIYCSTKEKQLKDIFRVQLNRFLFKSSGKKMMETNPERALVVPAGADRFEDILKTTPGNTVASDFVAGNSISEEAMNLWKKHIENFFGPPTLSLELMAGQGEGKESQEDGMEQQGSTLFREPAVDEIRSQRDEALKRYRKAAERQAKLERRERESSAPTTRRSSHSSKK